MRAAPLTPQTRESTLASGVADLAAASRKLAAVEAQQASREAAIQELCNSVWAVEQKQYSVSGKCGEAQQYTVTHQYTQNLAAISAPKFAALRVVHLHKSRPEYGRVMLGTTRSVVRRTPACP